MRSTLLLGMLCIAACVGPEPGADDARAPAPARFVAVGDAVVTDTHTGLAWTRHEQAGNLPWPEADAHCRALTLDGRGGWRLPSIDELGALYDEGTTASCGERPCHLDAIFTLTSPYVWSGSARNGSRRFYIDYKFGTRLAPIIRPTLKRHVLCVHDR